MMSSSHSNLTPELEKHFKECLKKFNERYKNQTVESPENFAVRNKAVVARRKRFTDFYKQTQRSPGEKLGVSVTWVGPPGRKPDSKPELPNKDEPVQAPNPPVFKPKVLSEAERKELEEENRLLEEKKKILLEMNRASIPDASFSDRPQSKYNQSYDVFKGEVWCSGIERPGEDEWGPNFKDLLNQEDKLTWSDITFEAYRHELMLPEYANRPTKPFMTVMGIKDIVNAQTAAVVLYSYRQRFNKVPDELKQTWTAGDGEYFEALIGTPNIFGAAAMAIDNPDEYSSGGARTRVARIETIIVIEEKDTDNSLPTKVQGIRIPEIWVYFKTEKE